MVAGLSFRAIVELITSNNESGLKSFLDTQHANIDDRNEVKNINHLDVVKDETLIPIILSSYQTID